MNRLGKEQGKCHAGCSARVFLAQTEVGDELEFAPSFNIAFSGCDLRCDFCITGSQSWNPRAGEPLDVSSLAHQAQAALDNGARTIMFLGGEPTIHLPTVLEMVAALPETARLVWKTNAYASARARELLDSLFDVWLADYKFGNDRCAERLSHVPRYTSVIRENLLWAASHTRLIMRHLLMPGHLDCCWRPVAEWLAESLPQVKVSLWPGFWPAWRAHRHPELRDTTSLDELIKAQAIAEKLNLNLIE